MNIATVVFAYNRSAHLKKVFDSLKNNDVKPNKLVIFQDGMKEDTNIVEWNEVNRIIHEIDWCPTEVIVSKVNHGLAESIVAGINIIFEKYDAVIVLEDDCVTHTKFLDYMVSSLEKYRSNSQVYAINGYSWPTDIAHNGSDAYFVGRAGSWGWATWKDRWLQYREDYKILMRIKEDNYAREQLKIWGRDLEGFLYGNIEGRCNSWTVFWALLVIEKHGLCLTPYESLVENIGFDGTGEHCGIGKLGTKLRDKDNIVTLKLPDKIDFPDNYEEAYRETFLWTPKEVKLNCYNKILEKWYILAKSGKEVSDYIIKKKINRVAVWGKGTICKYLLNEIKQKVEVAAIIESKSVDGWFCDIPIVEIENLPSGVQLIIVVPIFDFEIIKGKINKKAICEVIALDELLDRAFEQ